MTNRTWTQFDLEIVRALTSQVRVLSLDQIRRGWNQPTEDVRQQLARLVTGKLMAVAEWTIVTPPIGRTPMFLWKPGNDSPDAWRLSLAVRSRWQRSTTRHTVFQATDLAARLFGSSAGRSSRVYERQHDLLLAEVFVRYRQELPLLAEHWIGEEALPKAEYGVKNPDAFLIDDESHPRRVIESAGAYSQHQVETLKQTHSPMLWVCHGSRPKSGTKQRANAVPSLLDQQNWLLVGQLTSDGPPSETKEE